MTQDYIAEPYGNRMADDSREWAICYRDESGDRVFVADGLHEADAKLFVASPKLLAACRKALAGAIMNADVQAEIEAAVKEATT